MSDNAEHVSLFPDAVASFGDEERAVASFGERTNDCSVVICSSGSPLGFPWAALALGV